jgi:integral membrane sensor domain MASE1
MAGGAGSPPNVLAVAGSFLSLIFEQADVHGNGPIYWTFSAGRPAH